MSFYLQLDVSLNFYQDSVQFINKTGLNTFSLDNLYVRIIEYFVSITCCGQITITGDLNIAKQIICF